MILPKGCQPEREANAKQDCKKNGRQRIAFFPSVFPTPVDFLVSHDFLSPFMLFSYSTTKHIEMHDFFPDKTSSVFCLLFLRFDLTKCNRTDIIIMLQPWQEKNQPFLCFISKKSLEFIVGRLRFFMPGWFWHLKITEKSGKSKIILR